MNRPRGPDDEMGKATQTGLDATGKRALPTYV